MGVVARPETSTGLSAISPQERGDVHAGAVGDLELLGGGGGVGVGLALDLDLDGAWRHAGSLATADFLCLQREALLEAIVAKESGRFGGS